VTAALGGVRVVEFTTALAGPLACRYLAEAGAEVIKVESGGRGLDSFRIFSTDGNLDGSARFLESNLGVMSILLNLRSDEGLELAKELIRECDVLVDNFRPDVMERLGLGVEVVREVNPRMVIVKLPGFGSTGPRATQGSWGPNLLAHTGMTHLWNLPDHDEPIGTQSVYPDYVAAAFAPAVICAALVQRERTGRGTYVDLAQAELMGYMLGASALEWFVTGIDPEPLGNRSRDVSPHGCYPCLGDDRWCVVAVETDEQWARLARLMGQPELAGDSRFDTVVGRLTNRAEVDELVSGFTSKMGPFEVMSALQGAGIAAGVVQTAEDLWSDPQLEWRSAVAEVTHPVLGAVAMPVIPIQISEGGIVAPRSAPLLGEHAAQVLGELLGHSADQLDELRERGVLS
jgi:benzylsuccinate CoA-transferase BbsF subunit